MPSITEKDQKILWGRAAARCSFSDCHIALTHDASTGGAATIGQMAHIVGEAQDGPRGQSLLNETDRAGYANHILLCPTHHRIIDADPGAFPVELLHSIKSAHELWVEETLAGGTVDPEQLVYADLIDTITTALRLDRWGYFIENAIHDRIPQHAVDAQDVLAHRMLATIWPQTLPALKSSIVRLVDAYSDYIWHYMSNAEFIRDSWYGPDHSYAREGRGNYQELRDAEEHWSEINYALLGRLTVRLNQFADRVRELLNPLYFRIHGRFVIVDPLGTWHGGVGTYSLPHEDEIEERLRRLGWKHKLPTAD